MSFRLIFVFILIPLLTGRRHDVGFYQAPWPVRAPPAAWTADGSML